MEQPSIYLYGYLFHEPITALTNFLLCGCSLFFASKVGKSNAKYWKYFFYALAIATFFAAFGHALYTNKDNTLQLISRISNITGVFFSCMASSGFIKNKSLKLSYTIISIAVYLFFLTSLLQNNSFNYVKQDAIIGLGILTGVVTLFLALNKNKGGILILIGIIVNASTAFIHSQKISISKWFNHNDISHVILLIGFYFIALGATKLQDYANN